MEDINNTFRSPNQSLKTPVPILIHKSNNFKPLLFVFAVFFLITASNLITLSITQNKKNIPSPPVILNEIKWTKANLDTFSFDYPLGWQVLDSWSGDYRIIYINPEPIKDDQLTGFNAIIRINDELASKNPEAVFQQDLEQTRKQQNVLKEEIISTKTSDIHHFTIKGINEINKNFDEYYFIIDTPKSDKHIIFAQTYNGDLNDDLKKIIMSFKADN